MGNKGGILVSKEGSLSHLMTGKWNLGKTTVLRIPIVLKEKLKTVAEYFDKSDNYLSHYQNIIDYLEQENSLQSEIQKLKTENIKLKQELEIKEKLNQINSDSQLQNIELDKYQISVKCFVEYIESKNLTIKELSKERKNSKKYQLYEIYQWLKSRKSENNT